MIFPTTPSQTVGPFFAIGLPWAAGPHVVAPGSPGAISLTGTVRDGAGSLIPDHLIEIWQADPQGRFADMYGYGGASRAEGFRGWGRCGHEAGDGSYALVTVKPGPVAGPDGTVQAPHIAVGLFARGMTQRLVTRVYFADEAEANAADPVLARVVPERRETLLAVPVIGGYRWDIRVQGPDETVFFDV